MSQNKFEKCLTFSYKRTKNNSEEGGYQVPSTSPNSANDPKNLKKQQRIAIWVTWAKHYDIMCRTFRCDTDIFSDQEAKK